LYKQDIREGNLEYSKRLELDGTVDGTYEVTVTLLWFTLNDV